MLLATNQMRFKVLAVVVALALVMPMVMMPVGAAQASHTDYTIECPITLSVIVGVIAKAARGAAAGASVKAACTKAAKATGTVMKKQAGKEASIVARDKNNRIDKAETAKRIATRVAKEAAKQIVKREIKRGIEGEQRRGGGSVDVHLDHT